ncbi:MAG: glycosyltransferase family 39 protein [Ardenticatenales bacterium]|nr:glycosyltransferase family 39 protein [Ardenticatenales bacterium]
MRWRMIFYLSLLLYVLVGSYQLVLPGMNYDEALDAVPAMQFVLGQPLDSAGTVQVAGREWPLMVMPYIGATSSYLYIAAFALKGVSLLTLRQANLFLGFLTLLLMWGFLRDFLDERVATLSTLLLSLDPTYLFWTRFGAYVSLPLVPLALLTLWFLYRWYSRGQARYLLLAAFFAGLGLATKILFLWLLAALGLAWLLLTPLLRPWQGWGTWLWPLERTPLRLWLASGAVLVLGTSMLLLYNLQGLNTLDLIVRNAGSTELYGVNNLDILGNLRIVFFDDFRTMMDGGWVAGVVGSPRTNPVTLLALLLALGTLGWLAWRGWSSYSPRRLALLALLLVAIIFQSAFTITSLGSTHLAILWPIPQALIAAALFTLADKITQRSYSALILGAVIALLLGAESWTTWDYHRTLARTGGDDYYSAAVSVLALDLEQSGTTEPIALDWGFRRNLQFLTQGKVNPEERFVYYENLLPPFSEYINWRVTQEPTLYLFHPPEHTAFGGHWELFEEAAYRHHLEPVLWKEYTQGNGEPIYLVYQLEPVPPLFEPPTMQHARTAQVGEEIALLGYDLDPSPHRPGERVSLTLYWKALQQPTRGYKVFVHLFDAQGTVVAQSDSIPMSWGHPTTDWLEGEIIPDRVRLGLSNDVPPGSYALFIGMYDEVTGERLPLIFDGQRQAGDTLRIGEILVTND